MSKTDPLIGQTLGEFKILGLLGVGGMGRVYLGEQAALQRKVAVKVLPQHIVENESAIARFKREAILAARLAHNNIAHIYTIGQEEDAHFVAMELISGGDVASLLKQKKRIPVDEAAEIVRQALTGLAAAHSNGIIHRDIKPQNLMLTSDGTVKVADFGLARIAEAESSLTASGTVLGTPLYMSPEQGESKPVDQRTDIYSLGATFYHLICGRPPFEGDTPVSVMLKHLTAPVPSPKEIDPDIPEAICALISKMMAKQPDERYASCNDVLAELEPFCQAHPVKITPVPEDASRDSALQSRESDGEGEADVTVAVSGAEAEDEEQFPSIEVKEPKGEAEAVDRAAETQAAPPDYSEVVKARPEARPEKKAKKTKRKKKEKEAGPEPVPVAESAIREAQTQISKSYERRLGGPSRRRRTAVQEAEARKRLALFGGAVAVAALAIGLVYWVANRASSERPKPKPTTTPATITRPAAATPVVEEGKASTVYARWPFDADEARRRQEETAKALGLPIEKTIELPGGVEMRFTLIPAGESEMGITEDEVQAFTSNFTDNKWFLPNVTSQAPRHKVRITKPFYLGKYEVTQGQWRATVGENPSKFRDQTDGESRPAENMSWDDIQKEFLPKMQPHAEEGWRFRLPTEAEWEYACRAGTATKFYFGDSSAPLTDHGWFKSNSGEGTHKVGTRKPNAWGLYDMHGNVWERCQDYFSPDYYKTSPTDDPLNTKESDLRIIRSGAWMNHSGFLPSAYRSRCEPKDRSDFFGLRLVLEGAGVESVPKSEPAYTNSLGMKFVRIPAGEFMMGITRAEFADLKRKEPSLSEMNEACGGVPQHRVRISRDFMIGRYETTVGQFRRFVEETQYQTEAERGKPVGIRQDNGKLVFKTGEASWRKVPFEQTDEHPVVLVSHADAVAFCKWLNDTDKGRLAGWQYRLPTEAEWEYAARGTDVRAYPWGNEWQDGNANAADRRSGLPGAARDTEDGFARTAPVGSFSPNGDGPFGCADLAGNVLEWCSDWFAEDYYAKSPAVDPTGPAAGERWVTRGASWEDPRARNRTHVRGLSNAIYTCMGFRVVLAPKPGVAYVNPLGMKFVRLPASEFMMGLTAKEVGAWTALHKDDDLLGAEVAVAQPQHKVRISQDYYVGRTEVTVGQFRAFADATGYKSDMERTGKAYVLLPPPTNWAHKNDASWRKPYYEQTDQHPVVCVTPDDANAFAKWLNETDRSRPFGYQYRLPTEAEWEYAARGRGGRFFPWGHKLDPKKCNAGRKDDPFPQAAPVGSFSPQGDTPEGIADLAGNAFEWCTDRMDETYYQKSPETDPANLERNPDGHRVARGGCWLTPPPRTMATCRGSFLDIVGQNHIGFRLVLARSEGIGLFEQAQLPKWKTTPSFKDAKPWKMTNGVYEPQSPSFIGHEDVFADFVLTCEFLFNGKSQGGIVIRGDRTSQKPWEVGYELDIDWHKDKKEGHIHFPVKPKPYIGNATFEVNKWQSLRVEAEGPEIRVFLNGKRALRFQDREFREGNICLEGEPGGLKYRNVRIIPLTTREGAKAADGVHENLLGMKLTKIPAGEFMMGSTDDEVEALLARHQGGGYTNEFVRESAPTETPQHKVRITRDFFMGVHEVTQGQFQQALGKNPSKWQGENLPVGNVLFMDTKAFCGWLNNNDKDKPDGWEYRLPTEAEWEYACRAGTLTPFHFGDDEKLMGDYAWYGSNSGKQPHDVGTRKPNAWGLHDMHGNALEWVEDAYLHDSYATGPTDDPCVPCRGMLDSTEPICRGGSFYHVPSWCRTACRNWSDARGRVADIGFRVALAPVRPLAQGNLPVDGLVLYLPFDGDAKDASGRGRHGEVNGAQLTADRFGTANCAYSFGGGDQHIRVPTFPREPDKPMTVSVWVKFAPDNLGKEFGNAFICQDSKDRQTGRETRLWQLCVEEGRIASHLMGPVEADPKARDRVKANQWYHVVAIFGREHQQVHVDGLWAFGAKWKLPTGDVPLFIGRKDWWVNERLDMSLMGAVDDIRIYNRALTVPEVYALYHEGDYRVGEGRVEVPEDAQAFGSHYYKFVNPPGAFPWHEARRRCERMGGYLACIETKEENDFLTKLAAGKQLWIGLNDVDKEGDWRWVNGSRTNFLNWDAKQPDSARIQQGVTIRKGGPWGDDHFMMDFICEWESKTYPPGVSPFGGSRYKIFWERRTWHEAKARCEELGGHLACIESNEENDFLTKLTEGKGVWLGGTDEAREGEWLWVTGEKLAYTNWGPTQPNNGGRLGKQHYLWMNYRKFDEAESHRGLWDDLFDDGVGLVQGFVCEWEGPRPGEVVYENSLGMKFARIPAGEFVMGSTDAQVKELLAKYGEDSVIKRFAPGEAPQREVRITSDFLMAVHEVTQAQFQAALKANPSEFKGEKLPVENVSWLEAKAFVDWLNANDKQRPEGHEYRLPTEAEWEYACRAGTTSNFSFGNDGTALPDHAWCKPNAGGKSHEVGTRRPNAWSLFDMHGNVWEWCGDWQAAYPEDAATDPTGPRDGENRIMRGASWRGGPERCRSATRAWDAPIYRSNSVGFRVVLSSR